MESDFIISALPEAGLAIVISSLLLCKIQGCIFDFDLETSHDALGHSCTSSHIVLLYATYPINNTTLMLISILFGNGLA